MADVFVNKIATFFPNAVVENDEMEEYLGYIDGKSSRSRPIVLRENKIQKRYYALNKQQEPTHTNAQMTAEAIRKLCDDDLVLEDIEVIACGTATPDEFLPSHSSMVHGELGGKCIETVTFSGSCCSGVHAFKYSYLNIFSGFNKNTVATGSERVSIRMLSRNFSEERKALDELEKKPLLAFEKDFLRWMLSDGAVAVLLQDKPNKDSLSLKVEWVELCSFANEVESCMYAGGDKNLDGSLKGWADYSVDEQLEKSVFAFKQDTRLLENTIGDLGTRKFLELLSKYNISVDEIDYFLPHISSFHFKKKIDDSMKANNVGIPEEKWFTNLDRVGNVGSASIFLALEELMNSGRLKKGEKLFLAIPESARFSYGYIYLTVV